MASVWCDNCGDEIDFFDICDGPNGEFLCDSCSQLDEYQILDEDD